jgi:hypothetical protein
VLYPGGSHHVAEKGRPSFRVDYFNRLVEWIERWTREPTPTPKWRSRESPGNHPSRRPPTEVVLAARTGTWRAPEEVHRGARARMKEEHANMGQWGTPMATRL